MSSDERNPELRALLDDVIEGRVPPSPLYSRPFKIGVPRRVRLQYRGPARSPHLDVKVAPQRRVKKTPFHPRRKDEELGKVLEAHGWSEDKQGKTFAEIARIIEPELSNVKHLSDPLDAIRQRIKRHFDYRSQDT